MKRRRPGGEGLGLSFLDVVTCGFGAVVLLLLLSRPGAPDPGERAATAVEVAALEDRVALLRERRDGLRAEAGGTPPEASAEDLAAARDLLARLRRDNEGLERVREAQKRATVRADDPVEERDPEVGGIPVDSDYVIFIIDTSGSMKTVWARVMAVIERVLDIHPTVRGFQILNDNGVHLVNGYRGRWIPDRPRLRRVVMDAVRIWNAVSNSSPVEGLQTALRLYGGEEGKVAVYIFGDDFTGRSYERVVDTLEHLNVDPGTGARRVRVHAVGFISETSNARYATLMREVTRRNDGTFLALPPRD